MKLVSVTETNENKVFKFDYAEPRCNIKNRQISTK